MERKELIEDIYALVNRVNQVKNKELHFQDLPTINMAALHLMEVIEKNPNDNASGLAELLGITKGALSQQVKKLEGKGLVERTYIDGNNKEVMFRLTDAGRKVHQAHEEIHSDLYGRMDELLGQYEEQEIEKLHQFLRGVERYMRCCVESKRKDESR